MSTFISDTKSKHDTHQSDVRNFNQNKAATVLDFIVSKAVKAGNTSLDAIAKATRLTPEQIKNGVTPSLFLVSHDSIRLV